MIDLSRKKKIALVLSGGGIKAAAYHIGVCLALKEKGFIFGGGSKEIFELRHGQSSPLIQMYVGSSAGAFVSAVLASGRPLESLISAFLAGIGSDRYYKAPPPDEVLKPIGYRHIFNLNGRRMLSFLPETLIEKSLLTGGFEVLLKKGFKLNGFFNTNGIERYLSKYVLDENEFQRLGAELYIISTQLNKSAKTIFGPFLEDHSAGAVTYFGSAKISAAVAASTALPPVFAPYKIIDPNKPANDNEIYHYDGEIRDTLSTHVAADHGADLVIASYSMQPYHYTKEIGSLHKHGIPTILNQALYQVLEQKVARHIEFQTKKADTYSALKQICKDEGLSSSTTKLILTAVEKKLDYSQSVDYLYIPPRHNDYELFFADHFSLNPKILEKIVWSGFKAGIQSLREISF